MTIVPAATNTYITDIVDGVTASLELLNRQDDIFEIINLGESESIRLSRLVELIGEVVGVEPKIDRYPEQPGDVSRTFADISKARRLLGYHPARSIEEGLERFIDWFRMNEARLI